MEQNENVSSQKPTPLAFATYKERRARWAAIDPDKPLTKRERLFVAEYLRDLDAASAMRRIGRGGKNPDRRADDVMRRNNVKVAIERAVVERENAAKVSVERLEKRWADIAFGQFSGPVLASHVLQAMEALGKMKGVFKPETQTVIPVQFVFQGAPSDVQGQTIEVQATLLPDKT